MNSKTQDMFFRLSVVLYYQHIDVIKTTIRYKLTRQFVYFGFVFIRIMICKYEIYMERKRYDLILEGFKEGKQATTNCKKLSEVIVVKKFL